MFLHSPVLGEILVVQPTRTPVNWYRLWANSQQGFATGLDAMPDLWNFYHTHFVADIQVIPGVSPIIVDTIPTTHPDDGDLEGQSLARKDECLLINKTQTQSGSVGLKVGPTDTHHCFDGGILIYSENVISQISQILLISSYFGQIRKLMGATKIYGWVNTYDYHLGITITIHRPDAVPRFHQDRWMFLFSPGEHFPGRLCTVLP